MMSIQATGHRSNIQRASPYAALFRDSLVHGVSIGASDIHFLPFPDGLEIRMRTNGDIIHWKRIGQDHHQGFINEVKRLSGLSIAVSGRSQDGRTSIRDLSLDLRANLIPTLHGEKVVLRLLDQTRNFSLDKMGLSQQASSALRGVLKQENGIILISGPTGSGKTTTLYSLINCLDRDKLNIVTIEDPIEYTFNGLTQVQISEKITFAGALRAILRQDPDVILVGEIRDQETAELAFKAALTGHLVLSTIHANNSVEVISRLMNLGVDSYVIKTCLKLAGAQRLVKTLCVKCSLPIPEYKREKIETGYQKLGLKEANLSGCEKCFDGFSNRKPILEYLTSDAISAWTGSLKDLEQLVPQSTLRQETLNCVVKGEACASEIFEI